MLSAHRIAFARAFDGYVKAGRFSARELARVFEQTGLILNKLSLLHRGASFVLELQGANHYEQALGLIAAATKGSRRETAAPEE